LNETAWAENYYIPLSSNLSMELVMSHYSCYRGVVVLWIRKLSKCAYLLLCRAYHLITKFQHLSVIMPHFRSFASRHKGITSYDVIK